MFPNNVGIEDKSIDNSLSNCEIQNTDEKDYQDPWNCKDSEECQVVIVGAVDAVWWANCQAVSISAAAA